MSAHPIHWESWELAEAADRRFRLICLQVAVPALAFALAMSLLEVQRRPPAAAAASEHRYAQLLPPPPAEAPAPPPEPLPAEEPEPAPREPEARPEPPQARAEPRPEPVKPPEPTPEQLAAQARERASRAGLASLGDELAALRESQVADRVASGAAVITGTGAPAAQASSDALTGESRGSGGIDTGDLSRGTGANQLAERSTTRVQAAADSAAAKSAARSGTRDREEVEEVFDQNKGAIYALYNRALRDNPVLQGKLVLRLTIEADGSVSSCEVVSSELNDPGLESRLIERVKLFRFKAKDIGAITTTKPIDFFPAS